MSVPYVDCRSTSSGTSDMSDYIETLSISSHSSSDVHSADIIKLVGTKFLEKCLKCKHIRNVVISILTISLQNSPVRGNNLEA